MVVEGAVLLGVEGFQQSGRWVAPEVACQLVDLVQKHQGFELLAEIMAEMILPGIAPM